MPPLRLGSGPGEEGVAAFFFTCGQSRLRLRILWLALAVAAVMLQSTVRLSFIGGDSRPGVASLTSLKAHSNSSLKTAAVRRKPLGSPSSASAPIDELMDGDAAPPPRLLAAPTSPNPTTRPPLASSAQIVPAAARAKGRASRTSPSPSPRKPPISQQTPQSTPSAPPGPSAKQMQPDPGDLPAAAGGGTSKPVVAAPPVPLGSLLGSPVEVTRPSGERTGWAAASGRSVVNGTHGARGGSRTRHTKHGPTGEGLVLGAAPTITIAAARSSPKRTTMSTPQPAAAADATPSLSRGSPSSATPRRSATPAYVSSLLSRVTAAAVDSVRPPQKLGGVGGGNKSTLRRGGGGGANITLRRGGSGGSTPSPSSSPWVSPSPVVFPVRSAGSRMLRRGPQPRSYLALCSVQKDSHKEVREWVEYHLWLGVGFIYLWDDHSRPSLLETVGDYVASGHVMHIRMPDVGDRNFSSIEEGAPPVRRQEGRYRMSAQGWGFDHCLQPRVRRRHRWIASIDGDEFLVMRYHGDLKADREIRPRLIPYLQRLEGFAGVLVNWVVFGTSGHKLPPPGGVLWNYHACLPPNASKSHAVKTIANTAWALSYPWNMHRVGYREGHPPIARADGTIADPSSELNPNHSNVSRHFPLALHHYALKSGADMEAKLARGTGDGQSKSRTYMDMIESAATASCTVGRLYARVCCPSLQLPASP